MKISTLALAAGVSLACVAAATAQTPPLQNGGFEVVEPAIPSLPKCWAAFNAARYRDNGDGLTPAATARTGTRFIELPTGSGGTISFNGFTTDQLQDPTDSFSPRCNPQYLFGAGNPDITLSGWFMIPASEPLVHHRAGLKLEFRRTADNSIYQDREYLDIAGINPNQPGLIIVQTAEGPGAHTDGQWVQFTRVFPQSEFGAFPLPPENPNGRVSVLAIRFGPSPSPPNPVPSGTIFWDDISYTQTPACPADFNMMGGVTVQDIFDFLSAYFSNGPGADFNGVGGITVQDIFDFLSAYFTGCP
jgi:hypothetical protein